MLVHDDPGTVSLRSLKCHRVAWQLPILIKFHCPRSARDSCPTCHLCCFVLNMAYCVACVRCWLCFLISTNLFKRYSLRENQSNRVTRHAAKWSGWSSAVRTCTTESSPHIKEDFGVELLRTQKNSYNQTPWQNTDCFTSASAVRIRKLCMVCTRTDHAIDEKFRTESCYQHWALFSYPSIANGVMVCFVIRLGWVPQGLQCEQCLVRCVDPLSTTSLVYFMDMAACSWVRSKGTDLEPWQIVIAFQGLYTYHWCYAQIWSNAQDSD